MAPNGIEESPQTASFFIMVIAISYVYTIALKVRLSNQYHLPLCYLYWIHMLFSHFTKIVVTGKNPIQPVHPFHSSLSEISKNIVNSKYLDLLM